MQQRTAAPEPDLYPPTVRPSTRMLPLPLFFARFIRNPLRALPRAVYHEPIVLYGDRPLVAWITTPDLIEDVLLTRADRFPKTRLDKRVLSPIVGDGLLTAEGQAWRWQRKLASPLFRHGELLSYVPAMVTATERQTDAWAARGPHIAPIDHDMTETTFDVITSTLLAGIDPADGLAIKTAARNYLDPITWELAAAMLMLRENIWHPGRRRMRQAAADERAAVGRLIAKRRSGDLVNDDLLARMLNARDPDTGQSIPDELLIDNLTTFLLAGHETTAKALTWTLYLLARAPGWQRRLRDEVQDVTGGKPINGKHIARLITMQRVLKESLRLYPPAPVMTRVTAEDTELGGKRLPARTLVVMPIFATHRHRNLWTDPDRFDPDRFLPENERAIARTQFMPFGYGPRICIGSSFAMIEAAALLGTLLQHAQFDWDGHTTPEPVSRITLRPRRGMPLRVTPI